MAKPIFIIELPRNTCEEKLESIRQGLQPKMPDWYVVVSNTSTTNEAKFHTLADPNQGEYVTYGGPDKIEINL